MIRIKLATAAAGAGLLFWNLKNESYKQKFPQVLRAKEENIKKGPAMTCKGPLSYQPLPTVINDPIHGTIPLHPLAVKIINTPQFQRLRHIHQLGGQHYVYPSAAYSRFEHSIGVYHLAGKLLDKLRDQQPELGITTIDVLCVQLSGLAHDLGHGPFSHLFDGQVVPRLKEGWEHEKGSVKMLDLIAKTINFDEVGITEKDWEFIKSLIICEPNEEATGRGKDKNFLYEIVANGRNGIDVDKWDYLTRDSYHLGIKCGFDYTRLLHNMRVAKVKENGEEGEELQICVRDKEAGAINSMFHTRFELYEKAYQHKVVQAAELMIAEALFRAAPHLRFPKKTMVECLDDMEAYTGLHDGVFFEILKSEDEKLTPSRELLERLQRRDLWKFIGEAEMEKGTSGKTKKETKQKLRAIKEGTKNKRADIEAALKSSKDKIKCPEVVIAKCSRTLGQKGVDPLHELRFYSKGKPDTGRKLGEHEKQITWPTTAFMQTWLRAYYTGPEATIPDDVKEAVAKAFENQGLNFITADPKDKSATDA